MRVSEIIKDEPVEFLTEAQDPEITGITNDSREVTEGSLYFAVPGMKVNGAAFLNDCFKKGAACVVTECTEEELKEFQVDLSKVSALVIRVGSVRQAMGVFSSRFYGEPSKHLTVIGITGTKGKTTTSYMIRAMLEAAGHKTGLVGTIEILDGKNRIPSKNTTPESVVLHRTFRDMIQNGLDSCVMEVSSQALKLDRVAGVDFDYGIFTNLSPDHIGTGEHASFEEYRDCKKKLFSLVRTGIFNIDDRETLFMETGVPCRILTYGKKVGADYQASGHELYKRDGQLGIAYELSGKQQGHMEVDLPGEFSIHNSLAAIAVADQMGVLFQKSQEILKTVHVRGRGEMLPISTEFTFMVDYAHNGMALKSLLQAVREYHPARIITIFGCGGNRDRSRRFEMGEVSGTWADFTVITSDNPRDEDPVKIMEDIRTGIEKTKGKFVEIEDRKEAIRYAILHARPGDIVILAGKGHEDYQEIRGVRYPMDERRLVREVLEEEDDTKICGYNHRYLA